mgnify:FL=1
MIFPPKETKMKNRKTRRGKKSAPRVVTPAKVTRDGRVTPVPVKDKVPATGVVPPATPRAPGPVPDGTGYPPVHNPHGRKKRTAGKIMRNGFVPNPGNDPFDGS